MIVKMMNMVSTNDTNGKRVCVTAEEDNSGGDEKFTFQIGPQKILVTQNFKPGDRLPVCVTHTQSGKNRVIVTVANSPAKIDEMRDLDKPMDDGT